MTGTIEGGWPYVIAAYGLSWAVWVAYVVSLVVRGRGRSLR
jgi:hypothetical protein